MQTFLPYPCFHESAACLDNKRLGKQRVEALTILKTLCGLSVGWRHHPAVKMWAGHEWSLLRYLEACVDEWERRGFKDSCRANGRLLWSTRFIDSTIPDWLGYPDFHASHRSNLLRKDPVWYGRFGWLEDTSLPYVWPV